MVAYANAAVCRSRTRRAKLGRGKQNCSSFAALIVGTILGVAVGAQERRFNTETSLVEVDVVVRDSNRQPVRGLTTADFTVFEDDVRQSVTSFAEIDLGLLTHQSDQAGESAPESTARLKPLPKLPSGQGAPPVAALVFEELGPEAQKMAAEGARAFAFEAIRAGAVVGVYALDRAAHVLAKYTNEPRALEKAIAQAERRASYPLVYAGEVPDVESGSFGPGMPSRSNVSDNQFVRGNATIDGLQSVVGSLAAAPGRKVIVLFSEGLALAAELGGNPDSALDDNRWSRLRNVIEQANRSRIAFYTVDAAGLRAQNPSAAARNMTRFGVSPFGVEPYVGLESLAKDTGGLYVDATNDLTAFAQTAIEDLRHYYLLGYTPANAAPNGKYRSIKVSVNRPDVTVRARKGYLAEKPHGR
jgi:VWFA-related protein